MSRFAGRMYKFRVVIACLIETVTIKQRFEEAGELTVCLSRRKNFFSRGTANVINSLVVELTINCLYIV